MISYNRNKDALEGSRMVFTGNYRNMNDYLTMVSSSFKAGSWSMVRFQRESNEASRKRVLDEETGDERN